MYILSHADGAQQLPFLLHEYLHGKTHVSRGTIIVGSRILVTNDMKVSNSTSYPLIKISSGSFTPLYPHPCHPDTASLVPSLETSISRGGCPRLKQCKALSHLFDQQAWFKLALFQRDETQSRHHVGTTNGKSLAHVLPVVYGCGMELESQPGWVLEMRCIHLQNRDQSVNVVTAIGSSGLNGSDGIEWC